MSCIRLSHRFFVIVLLINCTYCSAQVSFTDRSDLLSNSGVRSGVAMGVADINGDFRDDIIRLNEGVHLNIEYQNNPEEEFTNYYYGQIEEDAIWSLCVADIDNNGYNDILTGGQYDTLQIFYSDSLGLSSTELEDAHIFLQGSNFIDINNDGWLDIFACHDDGDNRKYRNLKNGQFIFDQSILPTALPNGNSGNYASIWIDFDNDNDLDLYISKCRTGVTNPSDLRRLNRLFRNDGRHNYEEVALTQGLQIGAQTWCAAFEDIDNDGDLDCFMINHGTPSLLYKNDGNGFYTDATAATNMLGQVLFTAIQTVMRDFDNDGYIDILITGSEVKLLRNNGSGAFNPILSPFGNMRMESCAIGDLNRDGYLDVYGGYANLINNPHIFADKLWMNNGGSNHYFVLELNGVYSNPSGIGTRIELYYPGGRQLREVRSGEGYGIQNSINPHFGLGLHTSIDSIIVFWPSGVRDKIISPEVDQFFRLNEGDLIHCSDVYNLHSSPLPATLFKASELIETYSQVDTGHVIFESEREISILPDFEVKSGGIFTSRIKECLDP